MATESPKSRLIALLLAIFLGTLGAHRFYVGKFGTGITILLLFVSVIFSPLALIWVLVDTIFIIAGNFADKDGLELKRWND